MKRFPHWLFTTVAIFCAAGFLWLSILMVNGAIMEYRLRDYKPSPFSDVRFRETSPYSWFIGLLIYMALLTVPIAWFVVWRRSRSKPAIACPSCDYNLTGNTTGLCPECGHVIATKDVNI